MSYVHVRMFYELLGNFIVRAVRNAPYFVLQNTIFYLLNIAELGSLF